ncbi:MAG: hypothetical protein OEU50_21220 [Gammaproteobacteria bacterium]|nr:hypothetical protein [Gammaproteobacteria bacterium]
MIRIIRTCLLAIILSALPGLTVAVAQTTDPEAAQNSQLSEAQHTQTIRRLQTIKAALEDRREQVRNLLQQLDTANELDQPEIRRQIAELQQRIRELTESFERTAINGASLRSLEVAEDDEFDWQQELVLIARPVLDGLKDATEKPRRIAELRASISIYQQQLEATRKALEIVSQLEQHDKPPQVAEGIAEVGASWLRRNAEIEYALVAAKDELRLLETEEGRLLEATGTAVYEFILGRGLTLLLALLAGTALWYVMRALRRLFRGKRHSAPDREQAARIRLLAYGFHLLTIVLVTLAVLSVFYLRGDVLLLSLAIIALVMLALGVWRFLPGYISEARLLLNAGAARERERIIYDGVPFRIVSLNLYSELRNPELEGSVRLPLATISQLVSRPQTDEDWFPCRSGDYLLLPDGGFAQVLQQTVEIVRLKVVGSVVQFATADFLQLNVRNLSREGFGVVATFGIDYRHQEISLDQVPDRLKSGLVDAFRQADLEDDLKSLVVDFSAAATNSLDYLIYATLDGRCAASYFAITRLIQRTCVDICNREGWVIPFTQVTIHQE